MFMNGLGEFGCACGASVWFRDIIALEMLSRKVPWDSQEMGRTSEQVEPCDDRELAARVDNGAF